MTRSVASIVLMELAPAQVIGSMSAVWGWTRRGCVDVSAGRGGQCEWVPNANAPVLRAVLHVLAPQRGAFAGARSSHDEGIEPGEGVPRHQAERIEGHGLGPRDATHREQQCLDVLSALPTGKRAGKLPERYVDELMDDLG